MDWPTKLSNLTLKWIKNNKLDELIHYQKNWKKKKKKKINRLTCPASP